MARILPLCYAVIFVCLCIPNVVSLKFLFYNPLFGKSHVMYVGKMADLLVKNGHEVVSYQPINSRDFNDTGIKLARNIQREPDYELTVDVNVFGQAMWTSGADFFKMMKTAGVMIEFFATSCKHQLMDEAMMQRLRDEKFDFGFTEYFDICGLAIFEKIGIQRYGALMASPLNNMFLSYYGVPSTLSFVPEMNTNAIPPLNLLTRTKSLLMSSVMGNFFVSKMWGPVAEHAKTYVRQDFSLFKKFQEASVLFVNQDEFLDFPRPITHKFHYVGGIGMQKPEKLEPKFEKIFQESKKGVVFMSFGTVTKSFVMPNETKKAFLEAFSEFPGVTFLWKYEVEDGVANGYKNVITGNWWPQRDLLPHPKLLAFITHGGANSIIESATAGAPVIAIPLFGDQSRNALTTEFRGFGVKLEAVGLTKEKIVEALRKIIENKSYNRNAKELSQIIRAKPHSADETFVKYSVFAAKYDLHSKLDVFGSHMGTIEFYNLDVFALLGFCVLVVLMLAFLFTRCLWRCVSKRCTKQKVE